MNDIKVCEICGRETNEAHHTLDDCIDETIDVSCALDIGDAVGFDREMDLLDMLIDLLPSHMNTMTDKRPEGEEDE